MTTIPQVSRAAIAALLIAATNWLAFEAGRTIGWIENDLHAIKSALASPEGER